LPQSKAIEANEGAAPGLSLPCKMTHLWIV
jgi:hypothetical protein